MFFWSDVDSFQRPPPVDKFREDPVVVTVLVVGFFCCIDLSLSALCFCFFSGMAVVVAGIGWLEFAVRIYEVGVIPGSWAFCRLEV